MTPKLEWDEGKRQRTLEKRGIDFADVAEIDWNTALTVEDMRGRYSEERFVTLGLVKGRLHVCAWCYRGENLRVISFRKANKREEKRYEQSK